MKKNKIAFWVSTVFLFLFEGVMPLAVLIFDPRATVDGVVHLGYPVYFGFTLIVFKVIGVVLLIVPRLPRSVKEWAYAGFAFDFIFAAISHLVVDGPAPVSFFPLIILVILIISYLNYFKVYSERS